MHWSILLTLQVTRLLFTSVQGKHTKNSLTNSLENCQVKARLQYLCSFFRNVILKINKKQLKKNLVLEKHYQNNTVRYKRPLLKIEQTFEKLEKAKHVDQLQTLVIYLLTMYMALQHELGNPCIFSIRLVPSFQRAKKPIILKKSRYLT